MPYSLRNCRLVSTAVILLAVVSAQALDPTFQRFKTLPDGKVLRLHTFAPEGEAPEGGRTAVVFFFGGGWVGGSPSQFYPQCRHLAARGVLAMAAEYRIHSRDKSTVAQSVADATSAIRYVRSHAGALGINPDHIISAGGSAGGHLAASTATLSGFDEGEDDDAISSRPNAAILFNPVIDTTLGGYTGKLLPKEGDRSLSPVHHVAPGLPPILVLHGTADQTVPFENVLRFEQVMKKAGNRCELAAYEGAGHGFFNPGRDGGKYYDDVVARMDAFIDSLEW